MWHTLALVLGKLCFFWDPFHRKVDIYSILLSSTDEWPARFARQRPSFPNKLCTIRKHGATCAAQHSSAKMSQLEFWFHITLAYKATIMASQSAGTSKKFLQYESFFLYNKSPIYSLSPWTCKTDCRSMFSFGSWNRNLTCFSFLKFVSSFLNVTQKFTKTNIQTLATEMFNF